MFTVLPSIIHANDINRRTMSLMKDKLLMVVAFALIKRTTGWRILGGSSRSISFPLSDLLLCLLR